jgi:uracil-DNA glycosylase family 4
MSLNLDKRQRAMLLEMGVRLWQPEAPLAALAPAGPSTAAALADAGSAENAVASAQAAAPAARPSSREAGGPQAASPLPTPHQPASAPVRQTAGQSVGPSGVSRSRPASPEAAGAASAPAAWRLGQAQSLYADSVQPGGARWLVLAETPAAALDAPVFEGDAGKLLDNMLRAARLHRAGAVLLAPLVRQGAAAATPELAAKLVSLIGQVQPDIVLLMGRLASQAVLASSEPFGRLRGQVHALHGIKTVVTHDARYLLRAPDDKGKAWADLCLAMSLTAPSA